MVYPPCPKCQQHSMIEVEALAGGVSIAACLYCDLPQEHEQFSIYRNHCWNCGWGIDSRFSTPSRIPGMAYHCSWCGKDLSEWKLRRGLITATELNHLVQLIGGPYYVTVLRPMCENAQLPNYR